MSFYPNNQVYKATAVASFFTQKDHERRLLLKADEADDAKGKFETNSSNEQFRVRLGMDLFTSPLAWAIVVVLSGIGLAASLPTYYMGRKGMPAVREKLPNVPEERWQQIEGLFERWGALILLLTVLPGFGTVIPPVAGANGVRPVFFILLVALTKLIRNWIIVLAVFGSTRALRNWWQS